MKETDNYDVTIIGGGLAGLALSIQLARKGYKVALFEKEQYPFHKVCGEYISMESWAFIESLGVPLSQMNLPFINKLIVTAPNGNSLQHHLPLGGFGISRYCLDNKLKNISENLGVKVFENCKVNEVNFIESLFYLQTSKGNFAGKICCGTYGKRSNLDIKWKRQFLFRNNNLQNYVGVKYHIKTKIAADTIALHNFKNGYCGISKIENDTYCLCYLTDAANLKNNNNSITQMEENVLFKNPHIKNIFEHAEIVYKAPLTISQISFTKKNQFENHILLCGDAAGLITPLCGNGMSMALHGSKLAATLVDDFLQNKIDREVFEKKYIHNWQQNFANRLHAGRIIQQLFGKIWLTNIFITIIKKFPALTNLLIKQTHGEPY